MCKLSGVDIPRLGWAGHGKARLVKSWQVSAKQDKEHFMNEEIVKRRSEVFQRSAEVESLVRVLIALSENESISYAAVRGVIKENPQAERGRGITCSARRICRNEFKVIIECEPRKGFKRVDNDGIADLTSDHRMRIRKRLKLAHQELAAVEVKKLSNGAASKFYIELSWVGTLKQFSGQELIKQIGEAVKSEELAVGDVLKLCGGK